MSVGEYIYKNLGQIIDYCNNVPDELNNLLDIKKSKKLFDLNYAFFIETRNINKNNHKKSPLRYKKDSYKINGKEVRITNDWYERNIPYFNKYLSDKGLSPVINYNKKQAEKQVTKNITKYNIFRMVIGFLLLISIINFIVWYIWYLEIALICFFSSLFILPFFLPLLNGDSEEDYFNPNEKKELNTIDLLKGIFFGPIIVFLNCRWCKTKGKLIEVLIFGIFLAITYISIPVISWHYYFIRKPVIEEAERPIKEAQREAERLRKAEKEATERPLKEVCKARGQHLYQNKNGYYCDNTWYEKLYEVSIYGIAKIKTDIEKAQEKNR